MLDTLDSSISTHASNKSNPHAVTKAQVGLDAYPTSPADIGISTATQTALDGKVGKTGNEDIAGIKNFLNEVHLRRDVGGYGGISFYNSNVGGTYEEITGGATGGFGGLTTRTTGSNNIHVIDFGTFTSATFMRLIVRRPSATNVTQSAECRLSVNSDGEGWMSMRMRSSPSTIDVVNTKYVLDRVDEMVGYVDDAIDAIELMPGPKGDKGDKGDPCTMDIELRDVYDIMRGINVGLFQSYQPSTEKTTWVVLQDTVPGYKKTVSMGPSDDPEEHTIKMYKTGDTLLTTKEFFVPKGWYVGFHIPTGPNEVSLIGQVHNFDVT